MSSEIPKPNILQILKRVSIVAGTATDKETAEALGVAPQTLSNWKNEGRGLPWKTLFEFSRKSSVSLDWLLTGEEQPSPNLRVVKYDDIPGGPCPDDYHAIPIVPGEVAAGLAGMVEGGVERAEDWAVIHTSRMKGMKDLIAVEVSGGSMHPLIPNGSLVAIHRNDPAVSNPREILPRRIYAFRIRHGGAWITTIKRAEIHEPFLVLLADNPEAIEHRGIVINLEEEERADRRPVIGRVVWVWKELP